MDLLSVNCAKCGAPIKVPSDVEFLNCVYCGASLTVQKGEGYVALKLAEQVNQSIKEVGIQTQDAIKQGTQVTQYELKRLQINQELSSSKAQLSNIQSEIRSLQRQKQTKQIKRQLKYLNIQEISLNDQIGHLQSVFSPKVKTPEIWKNKIKIGKGSKVSVISVIGLIGIICFCCFLISIIGQSSSSVQATKTSNAEDKVLPPTIIPQPSLTPIITSNTIVSTPLTQIESTSQANPNAMPSLLNSLSDFENSQFCKIYECKATESWVLKAGGIVQTYDTNFTPIASIGITILSGKPVGFGLTFFYRENLNSNDLQYLYLFLQAIHPGVQIDNTIKNYIEQNINYDIFQICQASPIQFGMLKIWAGKVIEQTISVGDSCSY